MKYNSKIHNRYSIRLKNYDYSSNGVYYITICTQDKEMLFGEVVGATLCGRPYLLHGHPNNPNKMVEKWLFEIENKFKGTKIDKYVIVPDHIHFIIIEMSNYTEGDHTGSPLRDIVGCFKTMTTNEYIRSVKDGLFPLFNRVFILNSKLGLFLFHNVFILTVAFVTPTTMIQHKNLTSPAKQIIPKQ